MDMSDSSNRMSMPSVMTPISTNQTGDVKADDSGEPKARKACSKFNLFPLGILLCRKGWARPSPGHVLVGRSRIMACSGSYAYDPPPQSTAGSRR